MLKLIQIVPQMSGNRPSVGTGLPRAAETSAPDDDTSSGDEFAALFPTAPASVTAATQNGTTAKDLAVPETTGVLATRSDSATSKVARDDDTSRLGEVALKDDDATPTGFLTSSEAEISLGKTTAARFPIHGGNSAPHDLTVSDAQHALRQVNAAKIAPTAAPAISTSSRQAVADAQQANMPAHDETPRSADPVALQQVSGTAANGLAVTPYASTPIMGGVPAKLLVAPLAAGGKSVSFGAPPSEVKRQQPASAPNTNPVSGPDVSSKDGPAPASAPLSIPADLAKRDLIPPTIAAVVVSAPEADATPPVAYTPPGSAGPSSELVDTAVVDPDAAESGSASQTEPAGDTEKLPGTTFGDPVAASVLAADRGLERGSASISDSNLAKLLDIPAEIIRQNIRHLAETAHQIDRGTVEITLTPEDLGQVRLTVKSHDATGATVILQADRPETLDLMRRHVELLAQDMREMGYRELTFTFQDRQHGDHRAPAFRRGLDEAPPSGPPPAIGPGDIATAAPSPSAQDGRLDIRI